MAESRKVLSMHWKYWHGQKIRKEEARLSSL